MEKKSIYRSLIAKIQEQIKGLGPTNKSRWEFFSPFNEMTAPESENKFAIFVKFFAIGSRFNLSFENGSPLDILISMSLQIIILYYVLLNYYKFCVFILGIS